MNNVAVLPYYALHGLQILNVKRNSVKIMEATTTSHEEGQRQNDYSGNSNTSSKTESPPPVQSSIQQSTPPNIESNTTQINALPNNNTNSLSNTVTDITDKSNTIL